MLNFAQVKKFCISTFIGSLIVAALVAVIAVLLGEFNEVTWRVFATLFVVVVHSLVSLSFIWDDTRNKAFARLSLFINTVFLIIVVSFFLSVFGIWKLIAAETIRHLYVTLFFIGFGSLHVDVLSKVLGKEKYMDAIIYANYVFIAVVLAMLQPIIYVQNADAVLGPVFFRILAAAAIVDGTLSILTMIFYKLYLHKHPESVDVFQPTVAASGAQPAKKGGISFWVLLLLLYVFFQIVLPLFWMVGRIRYMGI